MNKMYALGRLKNGEMNKTEQAYRNTLELMRIAGEILWYRFEGIKLKLADNTTYTPDFFVMRANGEMEVYEVKGYMLDDANVKIKIAASIFPFRFFIVRTRLKRDGGGWDIKEVGNHG